MLVELLVCNIILGLLSITVKKPWEEYEPLFGGWYMYMAVLDAETWSIAVGTIFAAESMDRSIYNQKHNINTDNNRKIVGQDKN